MGAGDAFVCRYYDNEEEEWVRRSLTAEEADPAAPWVQAAAKQNSGRSMSAYTTGGSLQRMLQHQQGGGSTGTGGEGIDWSQTQEDVEVSSLLLCVCLCMCVCVRECTSLTL